jgi:hypothetical protein
MFAHLLDVDLPQMCGSFALGKSLVHVQLQGSMRIAMRGFGSVTSWLAQPLQMAVDLLVSHLVCLHVMFELPRTYLHFKLAYGWLLDGAHVVELSG